MLLSKTDYILWRECPHNAWLKKHRPEAYLKYAEGAISDFERNLIEAGNEVEEYARQRYSGGILIERRGEEGLAGTREQLRKGTNIIYQAAFSDGLLFSAVDILIINGQSGAFTVLEVKATSDKKEIGTHKAETFIKDIHVQDLGFQVFLLKRLGCTVERAGIVRINGEYRRNGALDLAELFAEDDLTQFLDEMNALIGNDIASAVEFLGRADEPAGPCCCFYKGRSGHCTTFRHTNMEVPRPSVHDIVRIGASPKKLRNLLDRNILRIEDIPAGEEFSSEAQQRQVTVQQQGRPHVDADAIRDALRELIFPLYFLDYETFNPAIPRFDGYTPYQHIPFQYSLHVARDAPVQHHEFLYTGEADPAPLLFESLGKHIGDVGSVVVWNRSFEESHVNKRMMVTHPQYRGLLLRINARLFDLMEIFKKQYHVMPEYQGSYSIKKVLPALVGLSYEEMAVGDGSEAMNTWNQIVMGKIVGAERAQREKEMREYCKLDTRAMYEVLKKLREVVAESEASD